LFQLDGQTPHFFVTVEEGDISNLCQYKWYEWIYFRENKNGFPLHRELLGRSLMGPAKGEGNEMAHWCLKANGQVVPRRTHRPLSADELLTSDTELKKRERFIKNIASKYGTSEIAPTFKTTTDEYEVELYEDDDETLPPTPDLDDPVDATGRALDSQPAYDQLINAGLMLPNDGEFQPVTVIGRTLWLNRNPEGKYNAIPQLNTMTYDVLFPDGNVKEYAVNIISENILQQVDNDGYSKTRLDCIVDHRTTDAALTTNNAYTTNAQDVKRLRNTMCGWQLLL
jgi:hypothetical protein